MRPARTAGPPIRCLRSRRRPDDPDGLTRVAARAAAPSTGAAHLIVTHRWFSLIRCLLVYRPEIHRFILAWTAGGPAMVSLGHAQAVVAPRPRLRAHCGARRERRPAGHRFRAARSTRPRSAEVAPLPTWLGWTENLHECFLSCDNRPGYIEWLVAEVPGSGWLGYEGAPITVGALILESSVWSCSSWRCPACGSGGGDSRRPCPRRGEARRRHVAQGRHDCVAAAAHLGDSPGPDSSSPPSSPSWNAVTPGTPVESPEVLSAEGDGPDIGGRRGPAALALAPTAGLAAVVLPVRRADVHVHGVADRRGRPVPADRLPRRSQRGRRPADRHGDRHRRRAR